MNAVPLEAFLEERLVQRPVAEWISSLRGVGVGAEPVAPSLASLMRDPWVVSHGLSVTREHDIGERITTVGPAARLSRTPASPGKPVASPGADAERVLASVGLLDRLAELQRTGAVLVESRGAPVVSPGSRLP